MASGHVNRTNRPNTWLHRPACKREEKPCQLGAVHTWHKADLARCLGPCPFSAQSGHAATEARVSIGRYCRVGPGNFHPEPLTEPDLSLSTYPARAIARRLPPSIEHRVPPVAG